MLVKIDGLVPSYGCPAADDIRDAYQSVPAWTEHLDQFADLQSRLGSITGTEGLDAWESWCTSLCTLSVDSVRSDVRALLLDDHYFDTFTSRTCHGHSLPCNITSGICVSEEDANLVHALGDFEYKYAVFSEDAVSISNSTPKLYLE